jgi:hypothetical protein
VVVVSPSSVSHIGVGGVVQLVCGVSRLVRFGVD